MRALKSVSVFLAALVVARTASANANITILNQPGLGGFTSIQNAINAASDGDVILITNGNYTAFTVDDKAVTVMAAGAGLVSITGTCRVKNLANNHPVSLVGLTMSAVQQQGGNVDGLMLTDNDGIVRLQNCTAKGAHYYGFPSSLTAGHGLNASNCKKVIVAQCTLTGADTGLNSGNQPSPGGDGLHAVDSTCAVYDSTLRGGRGSDETNPSGGKGGAGCGATNFGVVVSGSTLRGGPGGGGDYIGCTTSGDGGDALVIVGAQAQVLGATYIPGLATGYYSCSPGVDGQNVASFGGVLHTLAVAQRKLTAPSQGNDNASLPLTVTGQIGDQVWLLMAKREAFVFLSAFNGTLTVPVPTLPSAMFIGSIGSTGTLNYSLPIGDVQGPEYGWIWYLQGFCVEAQRVRILTSPLQVLIHNT